jgi:hypothetical protein
VLCHATGTSSCMRLLLPFQYMMLCTSEFCNKIDRSGSNYKGGYLLQSTSQHVCLQTFSIICMSQAAVTTLLAMLKMYNVVIRGSCLQHDALSRYHTQCYVWVMYGAHSLILVAATLTFFLIRPPAHPQPMSHVRAREQSVTCIIGVVHA